MKYYLLILKNYVLRLIVCELTKLVPRVRSAQKGAHCKVKILSTNRPGKASNEKARRSILEARMQRRPKISQEDFVTSREKLRYELIQ